MGRRKSPLTRKRDVELLELHKQGLTQGQLAERFGLSRGGIAIAIRRERERRRAKLAKLFSEG